MMRHFVSISNSVSSIVFKDVKKRQECVTWRDVSQIVTLSLLSLLLPLSFLLLARLSTAHYLLAVFGGPLVPTSVSSDVPSYVFLYVNSTLLYSLLSFVTLSSLVHVLTGRVTGFVMEPISHPRLSTAWILLCTLQACVGLGIEGSIVAGIDASGFRHQTSLLSKMIFFLGLHETMLLWSETIVKPVTNDTIFGSCVRINDTKWMERVVMGSSFGALWWWRLREEVDSLVVVSEMRKEVLGSVGVTDFMGWWLYYITVVIGVVRVFKGAKWIGMRILYGKVVHENTINIDANKVEAHHLIDYTQIDEKL